MGYYVEVMDAAIRIPPENYEKAVSLFSGLMEKETDHGSDFSSRAAERFYSWVNTSHVLEALKNDEQSLGENIADAFSYWGYVLTVDSNRGVEWEYRERDKWGDDEFLWGALAPCISEGSFIEFRAEDGAMWKYEFDGISFREFVGYVEWR